MTTYEIVADTSTTFALRNKATGQFDQSGFVSKAMIRDFWKLHFSWREGYRLDETGGAELRQKIENTLNFQ